MSSLYELIYSKHFVEKLRKEHRICYDLLEYYDVRKELSPSISFELFGCEDSITMICILLEFNYEEQTPLESIIRAKLKIDKLLYDENNMKSKFIVFDNCLENNDFYLQIHFRENIDDFVENITDCEISNWIWDMIKEIFSILERYRTELKLV